jgi:hypothetical protein
LESAPQRSPARAAGPPPAPDRSRVHSTIEDNLVI